MDELKTKVLKEQEYNKKLLTLNEKYALSEYSGRWSKFLTSAKAAELATDVEFRTSCGCCADSVVYARAFFDEDGIRIYAKPVDLAIGTNNEWGYGIHPWEYDASHLPQSVQDKIAQYLRDNPPEDFNDEEDNEL